MVWSAETPAEESLLAAVANGEWAELAGKEGKLRAGLLCALLLGQVEGVRLPPQGLRVRDATVEGELDLEGCGSPEAPLPALLLWRCNRGKGDARLTLRLRRAAMRFLDLKGSRIGAMTASFLRLTDGLDLRRVDAEGEVELVGANIGGNVSASGATLSNPTGDALSMDRASITGGVFLRGSKEAPTLVTGAIRLLGASIGGDVVANGATLSNPNGDALSMDRASITGSVFLRGSKEAPTLVMGEIRLLGASIGGDVDADGATLSNPAGAALSMDRASITGSVFLCGSKEAPTLVTGEIRLLRASIGGDVDAHGATLSNPDGAALFMDGASIQGSVFLNGPPNTPMRIDGDVRAPHCQVTGPFSLNGASCTGSVFLQGAKLTGGLEMVETQLTPQPGGNAAILDASFATLGPSLLVRLRESHGEIILKGAQVAMLDDAGGAGWGECDPCKPTKGVDDHLDSVLLRLDGFTYARFALSKMPEDALRDRKAFLMRQFVGRHPKREDFFPQPFEQAARALRAMGHPAQADDIAREKRAFQVRCKVDGWWRRRWSWFLGVGFGHFYKPWFAIGTLSFCVIVGLVFMLLANHAGFYGRKPDAVELRIGSAPRWQTCWDVPDGPLAHAAQIAEALLMSLDLLLPLIDLKQNERCEVKDWRAANDVSSPTLPTLPANNMAEAWWSSLLDLYAGLGLIIIPLFVATVSGLARRE